MPLLYVSSLFIMWWCVAVHSLCLSLLNQLIFVGVCLGIGLFTLVKIFMQERPNTVVFVHNQYRRLKIKLY